MTILDRRSSEHILHFWFQELSSEDWFKPSPDLDSQVRKRFTAMLEQSAPSPAEFSKDAPLALAAVLLYDQFSRNIHRGLADAFAYDQRALQIAQEATKASLDKQLNPQERAFLYMPFMHSERLADQQQSLILYRALDNAGSLRWALDHFEVIHRFGRFPHRNAVLGRENTAEETAFLATAERYGQ